MKQHRMHSHRRKVKNIQKQQRVNGSLSKENDEQEVEDDASGQGARWMASAQNNTRNGEKKKAKEKEEKMRRKE